MQAVMRAHLPAVVANHYDAVWPTTLDAIERCRVFLLVEEHDREDVQRENGLFISHFATEGSVLLVEAEASLKPCLLPTSDLYVDTPHITKERTLGWDIEDYHLERISDFVYSLACAGIEVCLDSPDGGDVENFESCMHAAWHEHNVNCPPDLRESTEILVLVEEMVSLVAKEVGSFCKSIASHKLQDKKIALVEKLFELRGRYFSPEDSFFERTKSLVKTLERVHEHVVGEGNVFLVAGSHHLEQCDLRREGRAFSLAPLHEFLSRHPDVVILKSKRLSGV